MTGGDDRVVVKDVIIEDPLEVVFVQDDHVVEAFPANRSNHAPRSSFAKANGSGGHFDNTHVRDAVSEGIP